jgi:hypothetical protein
VQRQRRGYGLRLNNGGTIWAGCGLIGRQSVGSRHLEEIEIDPSIWREETGNRNRPLAGRNCK